LVVAALAGACGKSEDASARDASAGSGRPALPPLAVRVGKVAVASAPIVVRGTGSFEAQEEVTVAAEVAGRVVEIGPEIGDRLGATTLLARVDETDYVLLRDQRARVLAESLTRIGLDRLPEGDVDFERLPSVEKARHEVANAKARHDRAVGLVERTPGALSAQEVGDLHTALEIAESTLRGARLSARIDLAQARTRAADLAVAEQNVRDTKHPAPAGTEGWVVAERRVAVGDYVSVGTPLYRLADTDPLRLVVRIPERRMPGVEKGRPATVHVATQKEPVEGEVLRLRPEVDLKARTHEVEVAVANPEGRLAVGSFAVVDIRVGEDPEVPAVPKAAVVSFAGVTKVFFPKDGKAAEKRVTLGRDLGDRVEVVEGLAPGDEVILDPPSELVTGTPLEVGPPAATPSPSSAVSE
jgi:RND family efflux transporter MFP subunit